MFGLDQIVTSKRKRKLILVVIFMCGFTVASGLILYALRQNLDLYYTPEQLLTADPLPQSRIRIGGMVQEGSIAHADNLSVTFTVTDYKRELKVAYKGILPDLFKDGQGVVALGKLNDAKVFEADQILAKHDENYMPELRR